MLFDCNLWLLDIDYPKESVVQRLTAVTRHRSCDDRAAPSGSPRAEIEEEFVYHDPHYTSATMLVLIGPKLPQDLDSSGSLICEKV